MGQPPEGGEIAGQVLGNAGPAVDAEDAAHFVANPPVVVAPLLRSATTSGLHSRNRGGSVSARTGRREPGKPGGTTGAPTASSSLPDPAAAVPPEGPWHQDHLAHAGVVHPLDELADWSPFRWT